MPAPEQGKQREQVAGSRTGISSFCYLVPQDSQLIASARVRVLEVKACIAVESVTSARGGGQMGQKTITSELGFSTVCHTKP